MLAATTGNDPFYERLVRGFYAETRQRHSRLPLVRRWQFGVAVCVLPPTFDDYFMMIEAAGRRNFKKATRLGYRFERMNHNDHLAGMREIHSSTDVRQGEMPADFISAEVKPCNDPPSRTNVHDYPYFGIMKDGRLAAYAGNMVSGELFMIEQMYGHADHLENGVVPMLVIGMARHIMEHYPQVKYYGYEMYYGASESMRRFKKKFCFLPHRVKWELGEEVNRE